MLNDEQQIKGYERDGQSGALLSSDLTARHRHMQRRKEAQRVSLLEQVCADMRDDIKNIQKQIDHILN